MRIAQKTLLCFLFLFIVLVFLFPNPFGDNPDIIGDESYFLTSALSSIEKGVLPGWDFPMSGTYYGGPQVYIDTAVLIPSIAVIFAKSHFSLTATKLWVASHTAELLHILRIVNEVIALAVLSFFFVFFRKRMVPKDLALTLTLFASLLLSNVLFIEFLHTAKMWTLYTVMVAGMSALFIAQEYYLARLGKTFLDTKRYVAIFVWISALVFFQSYVGVFSIGVLGIYALLLRHFSVTDIWEYLKKCWYFLILFASTQISFVHQAFVIRAEFADVSVKKATGTIDWFARLSKPLVFSFMGQPLSVLYVVAVAAVLFLAFHNRSYFADTRKKMYIAIACIHPLLVYLFYHALIGFSIAPRYAIMLTVACVFSAAILLSEIGGKAVIGALALSGALFLVVGVHAVGLYWQPSSETVLLSIIKEKYNSPSTVFIQDGSALHLTLPVNTQSLLAMNEKRKSMSRFKFLLQNQELLSESTTFKPITIIAYTEEEKIGYLERFVKGTNSVWTITTQCTNLCTAEETLSGVCFQIHTDACGVVPQEINVLPIFLSSTQLGYPYVVRKVR